MTYPPKSIEHGIRESKFYIDGLAFTDLDIKALFNADSSLENTPLDTITRTLASMVKFGYINKARRGIYVTVYKRCIASSECVTGAWTVNCTRGNWINIGNNKREYN